MRPTVLVAALGAAALVLAGCSAAGGDDTAPPVPVASHPAAVSKPAAAVAQPVTRKPTAKPPVPKPKPNPCAANTSPQWVLVSIAQQHMWMCAGAKLANETGITSGIPTEDTHTPTGTYQIQAKDTDTTLTLNTGQTYPVKYWIPFDAPLFGFHDSSWQTFPYGSQQYRTDGSHGCVHVPLAAIAWLYNWAQVGAAVTIR